MKAVVPGSLSGFHLVMYKTTVVYFCKIYRLSSSSSDDNSNPALAGAHKSAALNEACISLVEQQKIYINAPYGGPPGSYRAAKGMRGEININAVCKMNTTRRIMAFKLKNQRLLKCTQLYRNADVPSFRKQLYIKFNKCLYSALHHIIPQSTSQSKIEALYGNHQIANK